ncbi:MAG: CHAT domain-containing protein [Candidatus Thiodiazotropha sp. (ex Monitilora ramsayi)]|nr:CHAT domain-containing protein [Candidatus Thiodiazotropha sp. (ex Monitilora ramsayi)]
MTSMSDEEVVQALYAPALNILQGVISYENAVEQMDMQQIATSLSDGLAIQVSREAFNLIKQPEPKWQPAIALQILLYACLDARSEPPPHSVLEELAWNFVSATSRALWFVPDPWLYKQATEKGFAAVELAKKHDNLPGAGDLLHALGTLNLDPYGANRAVAMFDQEMQTWRDRASNGETWNHTRYYDLEADGYPSIQQAYDAAAKYYREAASLREGRARALSLKALAQTLYNSHEQNLPYEKAEIEQAAREALEYFDEKEDPAVYFETLSYLKFAAGGDSDISGGFPKDWLEGSIDRSVKRLGEEKTVQLVSQAYANIDDYPQLLRILLDAASLFKHSIRDDFYHLAVIRTFIRSVGAATFDLNNPPKESLEDLFNIATASANKEDWDPARYAAALLALADVSVATNEEAIAIHIVDIATKTAPYAMEKIHNSVAHLRAQLLRNDGVNAYRRDDWNESTSRYAEALSSFLELGETRHISKSLTELSDVVKLGDDDAAVSVCTILEDKIDSIEVLGGDQVTEQIRTLIEYAVRNQLDHNANTHVLWRLMQLSSARRFAAMLAAGSAHQLRSEFIAPHMLEQIDELRRQVFREGYVVTASDRLTDSVLLSPYAVDGIRMSGNVAAEQLANLEHQYDRVLNHAMAQTAMGKVGLLATEPDVQAYLGPTDVIVQFFTVDASKDGMAPAVLLSVVTTQEDSTWMAVKFGNQPRVKMEIDGVAVEMTELSAMVESLRTHIQEDPEDEPLNEEAISSIESITGLLTNPIQQRLNELHQAGKSHLCFVPPGPLAYTPFHVLGEVPGELQSSWTITYLPTLQLLVRNYGGPALLRRRDTNVSACGISFKDNTDGYEELPETISEARAVANTMGGKLLLEEDATERNLKQAMLSSEYVHICTHGLQNVVAPCFHKLVLSPDDEDDGNLHAHELLGMDLRGLKLVTLSACETALGRFDRGMNPHGLPATLLLAGTETVIGTLWEIESTCSERFFTTLYTLLGKGQSKMAAYNEALQVTREHHPEFRDWGAFYFLGDWN